MTPFDEEVAERMRPVLSVYRTRRHAFIALAVVALLWLFIVLVPFSQADWRIRFIGLPLFFLYIWATRP